MTMIPQPPKGIVWAIAIGYIAIWGIIDWRTGSELSLSVFYLPAVAWIAWHLGRWSGFLAALFAGVVWLLAEIGAGGSADNAGLTAWNAFVRFGFFCITGSLVAEVRVRRAAEKELAAQRALLGKILDALEDRVIVLDTEDRLLLANPAARSALAETSPAGDPSAWWKDLREKHAGGDFLPPSPWELRAPGGDRAAKLEFSISTDGEDAERRFEMEIEPMGESDDQASGLLIVTRDRTERYLLEKRISEISEFEKRKIGQELHDGLCQELAALAFHTAAWQQELETTGQTDLAKASGLLRGRLQECLRGARELSHGLFPAGLEDGLDGGLRVLAATFQGRPGCDVSYDGPVDSIHLSEDDAVQLYRIAQEAVLNALRHSGGTLITIRLRGESKSLVMEISDNGRGLPDARGAKPGIGLAIMRHRAGLVHGQLSVESPPGGGTRVICRVGETGGIRSANQQSEKAAI